MLIFNFFHYEGGRRKSTAFVYTFDDDGNIVSEYVYSEDTGNVGAEGEESGINPHSGDGGAGVVSNINNLLKETRGKETRGRFSCLLKGDKGTVLLSPG